MIRNYRLIWEVLTRKERYQFVLLLGLTVVMSVFEVIGVAVILPFLQVLADPSIIETNGALRWVRDALGGFSDQNFMIELGILVFLVIVLSMVVRAGATYALIRFGLMRGYTLSTRLLEGYLRQPYSWFLSRHTSELGQTMLSDVDKVVMHNILPAILLIANAFVTVMIAGLLFVVAPFVTLGAVGLLLTIYGTVYLVLRGVLTRVGERRLAANKDRFHVTQEATGGIKEVKVMGLEEEFLRQFRDPARRLAHQETLGEVIGKLPRFALEAVAYGGFILMILAMLLREGGNIADALPLLGLIGMAGTKLFPSLQQIYIMLSAMRFTLPTLEAVHQGIRMLEDTPRPAPAAGNGAALRLTRSLELRDLHFRYPNAERNILDGLSVAIPARSTVGIVGGTGAGKTTAIDLILGLLEPDSGEILVDGEPLTAGRIRPWQKRLGYVPQHIFLSDGSVAANIAFGIPPEKIDRAAVERAARVANLHDFVTRDLPEGYDTEVGERGVRLSGGQRQRIGIARALYHDPDVLILDEATSALDNLTERAVMEAVHNLGHQKTVIMIAHRLTTVKECDTILLLERGRLVASGTYDELVTGNETFRKMAVGA